MYGTLLEEIKLTILTRVYFAGFYFAILTGGYEKRVF